MNKVSDEYVKELFDFIETCNNDDRLIKRNFLTRMHRTVKALIAERDEMKKDLKEINDLLLSSICYTNGYVEKSEILSAIELTAKYYTSKELEK